MKRLLIIFSLIFLISCNDEPKNQNSESYITPLKLQLNWFHDPTFSGEYKAKQIMGEKLEIIEGGVNVSPIQRLKSGLADVVVVGIDIVLKAIELDLASEKTSTLRIVYVDFQRNPVGWIIHPNTAKKFGMAESIKQNGLMRNNWLFDQFRKGNIQPGDKRGTETTAVWTRWRELRSLRGVKVMAVGYDPAIMLDAPDLAYPVYMNEEPFKLGERIGQDVIVFDPADDGVELYGNVLVTRAEVIESRCKDINNFLNILNDSWRFVKESNNEMVNIVKTYYPDVSNSVLKAQISRTTDFVFYKTEFAGGMDLTKDGRLAQTVVALKSAGLLGETMDLMAIKKFFISFIRCKVNWNDIADAYLSISEDRDKILFPTLAKVIEETGATNLLDVGGGDGKFIELTYKHFNTNRFTKLGYTDTSSKMRERARLRLSHIDNNIQFFESLDDVTKNQWSIVTLIAVWMSIETEEECVTLLKKIKSFLGHNGRLMAAITHPCFRNQTFHSYSTNFDMGNYFRSGKKFKVNLYDSVRSLAIWDTHWTISDHSNQIKRAGLVIESIIELPDVEDSSEGSPWIVIIAKLNQYSK